MKNEKLYNNSTKHITIRLVPKENFQDRVGILISIQILYNHYTGTELVCDTGAGNGDTVVYHTVIVKTENDW